MKTRKLLGSVAIGLVLVVAVSLGGLRWQYGVWSPFLPPQAIEYNQWRYAPAWDGDFERMSRSMANDGESVPKPAQLIPARRAELPAWWQVSIRSDERQETYPEIVFIRTLDGQLHPYGYKGMPPSD